MNYIVPQVHVNLFARHGATALHTISMNDVYMLQCLQTKLMYALCELPHLYRQFFKNVYIIFMCNNHLNESNMVRNLPLHYAFQYTVIC